MAPRRVEMKTVAKVAIGCGVALLLGGAAAVAVIVGGAYWMKGKVEQVAGHEKQIQDLKKKAAAAAPFARPSDDVVREDRLVKFLEIRKRMSSIYQQHRAEIEKMQKGDKADLREAWGALAWINQLRLAHAQAQADVGMGDEEYAFLVEQVYKSAWAAASPDPAVEVSKANLDLFKKHEADIKAHAMSGLEMLGL
jgi:hypothetical protein